MKVQSKREIEAYEKATGEVAEARNQIEEGMKKDEANFKERQASVKAHLAKLDDDFRKAAPPVYEAEEVTEEEGRTVKTSFGTAHAEKGSYVLESNQEMHIVTSEEFVNNYQEV
jgi:hypothetical protein